MGKASRKKREAREARNDTADVRFADKRCMHCGARKQTEALWCEDCSRAGRRRSQFRAYPNFVGPDFTDEQVEILRSLVKDPRWAWKALVEDDLSHYDSDPSPDQGQPAGSAS